MRSQIRRIIKLLASTDSLQKFSKGFKLNWLLYHTTYLESLRRSLPLTLRQASTSSLSKKKKKEKIRIQSNGLPIDLFL